MNKEQVKAICDVDLYLIRLIFLTAGLSKPRIIRCNFEEKLHKLKKCNVDSELIDHFRALYVVFLQRYAE